MYDYAEFVPRSWNTPAGSGLRELSDLIDHRRVLEADSGHPDRPKMLSQQRDRFRQVLQQLGIIKDCHSFGGLFVSTPVTP